MKFFAHAIQATWPVTPVGEDVDSASPKRMRSKVGAFFHTKSSRQAIDRSQKNSLRSLDIVLQVGRSNGFTGSLKTTSKGNDPL
jgi:hypothetical protein